VLAYFVRPLCVDQDFRISSSRLVRIHGVLIARLLLDSRVAHTCVVSWEEKRARVMHADERRGARRGGSLVGWPVSVRGV